MCKGGDFACEDGCCISAKWHCDGDDDCKDAKEGQLSSDEMDCGKREGGEETVLDSGSMGIKTLDVCRSGGWPRVRLQGVPLSERTLHSGSFHLRLGKRPRGQLR